jgi:hypothetical protein
LSRFSGRLGVSGSSLFQIGQRQTEARLGAGVANGFLLGNQVKGTGANSIALSPIPAYDQPMAKAKKFELESLAPILDVEDEETLTAIDEGIRDARAGRTVPAEEVRKRLPKWIG